MQKKDKTHYSFLIALARQLDDALGNSEMGDQLALLRAGLATLLDVSEESGYERSGPYEVLDGDGDDAFGLGAPMERDDDESEVSIAERLEHLEQMLIEQQSAASAAAHLGGALPGGRSTPSGERVRIGNGQPAASAAMEVKVKRGKKSSKRSS